MEHPGCGEIKERAERGMNGNVNESGGLRGEDEGDGGREGVSEARECKPSE